MKRSFMSDIRAVLNAAYNGTDPSWDRGYRRVVSLLLRYGIHTGSQFNRDRCFLRAAALTYTTILTLIPILVLIFVIFQAFGGLETLRDQLETFLFSHMLPESVVNVRDYIQGFIHGFNSRTVSVVSIVFLLFAAYGLFSSIESSLNAVWNVSTPARIFSRMVNLWFILTVTPLFLGYSIYLSKKFLDLKDSQVLGLDLLYATLMWIAPTLLTWLALFLIYRLVPRASVTWQSAAIGGFIAAVWWEMSKFGFNVYVEYLISMELLYGSFILLPLFLIWIDLSWIIILGGAELGYTHQNLTRLHAAVRDQDKDSGRALSAEPALRIMFLIGRAFRLGDGPVSRDAVLAVPGMDGETAGDYLGALERAGLILSTRRRDHYTLARSPDRIRLNAVFDIFDPEDVSGKIRSGIDAFLADYRGKRTDMLETMTLADLINHDLGA
ncbi:YihY family inner membrane protein [bacterium]|nr:YihY family inner membrane protein [candidate division CSSED10-310 bacterium]